MSARTGGIGETANAGDVFVAETRWRRFAAMSTVPLLMACVTTACVAWSAAPAAAQQEPGQSEPDRFLEECGREAATDPDPQEATGQESGSRFSDQCKPLEEIPERPRPLLELGEPFLGTGTLGDGFTLPTGAVWQPALMAFGTIRTALQGGSVPGADDPLVEAVTRFDLFGNLYLTQTERVVVGFRPLDRDGRFTGVTISSPTDPDEEEFDEELNGELTTLFFEGDLAEVFPNLDDDDSGGDLYLSVGRQPLAFQGGSLIAEDVLDMVGLTKANVKIGSAVNTRIAGVFAWGQLDRPGIAGNTPDDGARLFGLFTETDLRSTTLNVDAAFVRSGDDRGDGVYAAVSDIRRFGRFNNTFRIMASAPVGDELFANRLGFLVHNQFSWTPHHSHDFWYVNAFAGVGSFRSALRGPSSGGPLGQTGVLFAAPGIGRIGAPLGGRADDAVGGAVGKQLFFGHTRQQLVVEAGGRWHYKDGGNDRGNDVLGGALRFQAAAGRRFVFVVDGVARYDVGIADLDADLDAFDVFGRVELVLKL